MKNHFLAALAIALIASVGCSKAPDAGGTKAASNNGAGAATADAGKRARMAKKAATVPAKGVATVSGAPVVGQPAPEVTGPDTDGQVFNLSDYKGKVVMLDFWGQW